MKSRYIAVFFILLAGCATQRGPANISNKTLLFKNDVVYFEEGGKYYSKTIRKSRYSSGKWFYRDNRDKVCFNRARNCITIPDYGYTGDHYDLKESYLSYQEKKKALAKKQECQIRNTISNAYENVVTGVNSLINGTRGIETGIKGAIEGRKAAKMQTRFIRCD